MSSVTKRFQVRDGEVVDVTSETPNVGAGSSIGITQGYGADRPGKSMGMGCHTKEIDLMNRTIREHGIQGVEYVPYHNRHGEITGGKCVITSRKGRARWMPVYGNMVGIPQLHDDEGGYSDG